MNCPKCEGTLGVKKFGQVEYDQCGSCKGMFFDLQEHEDLKAAAGSRKIDTGDAKKGKELSKKDRYDCPKCKQPMVRLHSAQTPSFAYESCSKCYGVFFDAGEFAAFRPKNLKDMVRGLFRSGS